MNTRIYHLTLTSGIQGDLTSGVQSKKKKTADGFFCAEKLKDREM